MVTPVTVNVGNGQTYTTLASAWATMAASIVTTDQSYTFNLYPGPSGAALAGGNMPTVTTDATHTITMQPAAGQGFKDYLLANPSSPLRYDETYGVAVAGGGDYQHTIYLGTNQYVAVRGLQFKKTTGHYGILEDNIAGLEFGSSSFNTADDCIFYHPDNWENNNQTVGPIAALRNSLVYGGSKPFAGKGISEITNCTFVRTSDYTPGTTAPCSNYSYGATLTATNLAYFGFTGVCQRHGSGGDYHSFSRCATDYTGTVEDDTVGSLVIADQIISNANATFDARTKVGAHLVGRGAMTGLTADLYGTARPQGAIYDIGVHELVSEVGGGGGGFRSRIADAGRVR